MIDEILFSRNKKLIWDRLLNQIDVSLEKGNKYIDKEMVGLQWIVIKPIVKLFYNSIKKKDMAEGTEKQIKLMMNAAEEIVRNSEITIDDMVKKYYKQFINSDQTTRALNKNHRNYKWLVKNQTDVFREELWPLVELLKVEKENIDNYDDLAKAAFLTKEKTMGALLAQCTPMEKGLLKIKEDLSILDLAVGRDILYKVLWAGYKETIDDQIKNINKIVFD